jgi:N-acetyl-anhydromuramyl-L-alanine amidase AmpD
MSLLKNRSQVLKRVDHPSPNFSDKLIPVEYVVIHYTACSLERTLEIFSDREKKVCAHFVLSENGDLYDLGNFYYGPIRQGAHAGETFFNVGGKTLRVFNEFSIGIEIVNLNGNVFPFRDAQYESLKELMLHLKNRFPTLNDPDRIVGHEQIAGHRGKADPGRCFDWARFYQSIYGDRKFPVREPKCSKERAAFLAELIQNANPADRDDPNFWPRISAELEARAAEGSKHHDLGANVQPGIFSPALANPQSTADHD